MWSPHYWDSCSWMKEVLQSPSLLLPCEGTTRSQQSATQKGGCVRPWPRWRPGLKHPASKAWRSQFLLFTSPCPERVVRAAQADQGSCYYAVPHTLSFSPRNNFLRCYFYLHFIDKEVELPLVNHVPWVLEFLCKRLEFEPHFLVETSIYYYLHIILI